MKVQRTIGFDKIYAHAQGAYLYDMDGRDYLDFLSGYSVYNIGRNHPALKKAISDVLELDLPNMVQMDCSLLSGLLAEALVKKMPAASRRPLFLQLRHRSERRRAQICQGGDRARPGSSRWKGLPRPEQRLAFAHGHRQFPRGLRAVTCRSASASQLGDLARLEKLLATKQYRGVRRRAGAGEGRENREGRFFQQGAGALPQARHAVHLRRSADGPGPHRTMFAFEHWNLEPDIITLAKSLSGGYVPCGAIVMRREIHQKTFSQLDRCVVHSSTFGRNNLAMACGLATLEVIDEEHLVENAANMGALLLERLNALKAKHPFIKEVRGKGLMIAIEFDEPKDLKLKMAWQLIHSMDKSLFTQMVVTSLLSQHRILAQVAGHNMDVVKILPPLIIGEKEVDRFVNAFDAVLDRLQKIPRPDVGTRQEFFQKLARLRKIKSPRLIPAEIGRFDS